MSLIDPEYSTKRRKVILDKLDDAFSDVWQVYISLVDIYNTHKWKITKYHII